MSGQSAELPDPYANDRLLVHSILANDAAAWQCFLDKYGKLIAGTAIQWCHRYQPSRICRFCHIASDDSCDEFQDAWAFLLKSLRHKILRSYRVQCSLMTYLLPVLRDLPGRSPTSYNSWKLFVDFVRSKKGRVTIPECLKSLNRLERRVFTMLRWGLDPHWIAGELRMEPDRVLGIREQIEKLLRQQGAKKYWDALGHRNVKVIRLFNTSSGDEGEETPEIDPEDRRIDLDRQQLIRELLDSLSAREQVALRMFCVDGYSAEEVGRALDLERRAVFSLLDNLRAKAREFLGRRGEQGPGR